MKSQSPFSSKTPGILTAISFFYLLVKKKNWSIEELVKVIGKGPKLIVMYSIRVTGAMNRLVNLPFRVILIANLTPQGTFAFH